MTDEEQFKSGTRITALMVFCLFFVVGWFAWPLWVMGAAMASSFLLTPTDIGPHIEID